MTQPSRRAFLRAAAASGGAVLLPAGAARTRAQAVPSLTLACADYVRLMPIATGDVRPEGVDLRWIRGDRAEMLRRVTAPDPVVQGGETSLAQHVMRIDAGDRSLVAVPVFPLRNFTVRDLYARRGAAPPIAELGRRRLGIYNWAASGAVWYRHLLRYWGHDPRRMTWVVGSPDSTAAAAPGQALPPNVTRAPAGASLSDLLLRGEIDAFFAPLPPSRHDAERGPIARVVPDFRPAEQRYFAETGCYPPQHVVAIRRTVWEAHPFVGRALVDAFNRSDARFQAAQRLYPYHSPWLIAEVEETERTLGPGYHAHGMEQNHRALDTFCQGAFDDGLTRRRLAVEEVFARV